MERIIADRHALDVSDQVHRAVVGIADAVRQGCEVPAAVADPVATALLRDARAMIDVDYAGSMPAVSKALALEYAANNIRFNTVEWSYRLGHSGSSDRSCESLVH